MENKTMLFEEIKAVLPHRYPFLLIDRVLEVGENNIRALKNVSANEPFFMGHFPQLAVMPGVLQVEAMAQAGGLLLASKKEFDFTCSLAFLAGVDNAKFKRMVTPGDQLVLEASITHKKAGVVKFEAKTSVLGELASMASIVLVIKPR